MPWPSEIRATEKYKPFEGGIPLPGQCGANSSEPSFAGGEGPGVGGSLGAGASSGAGGGLGSGAGTGGSGGSAVAARFGPSLLFRWCGFGLELIFTSSIPRCRRLGCRRRLTGFGATGWTAARRGRAGGGSATGRTSTRGNPTSAAKGGGCGGFSSPGSACKATSPTTASATTLPRATQRIRTPPTPAQDQEPGGLSPQLESSS